MHARSSDEDLTTALKHCAAEPVHIPGTIQSHGAMIAVCNQTLQVLYASINTSDILGRAATDLLSQSLNDLCQREERHALLNGMIHQDTGQRVNELGLLEIFGREVIVTASPAPGCTLFEFEPATLLETAAPDTLRDLEFLTSQLRSVDQTSVLFDKTVQLLQMLTGYDRVTIHEFDAEGHGRVQAEAVVAGLDPYLGLHFPAWDIPAQARKIMLKNAMRYIADVDGMPVPVLAATPALPPLDMTAGHLRGVSGVHMQYLRNMGTGATFTLNIVIKDALWGIISFNHTKPRHPSQRMRQLCRNFAEFFKLQLESIQQAAHMKRLLKTDDLRRKVTNGRSEGTSAEVFEAAMVADLAEAMQADGAAMLFKEAVFTTGITPPGEGLAEIFETSEFEPGVTSSSRLSEEYPTISAQCGPEISGILVAKLPEDSVVIFFRKDRQEAVSWAGAPEKTVIKVDGVARLDPRSSFAQYKAEVRGTSEPWTLDQKSIAEEIWSMLVSAEREALIERTNRQQSLLIDELNHRVRNILALIRSLSQQSLTHNGSIQSYVTALEARIAAVASAHDLGAEKTNLSATAMQILELEAAPYNQEDRRVTVQGKDVGIRSELAPMFALVVHELMTNAVKYGALSRPEGHVSVELQRGDNGLRVNWREDGGPEIQPPEVKGFGTTLIETSVPFELDGKVELDYHSAGLRAVLTLPESVLVDKVPLKALDVVSSSPFSDPVAPGNLEITKARCLLLEDNYVVSLDTARVLKTVGFETVETALNVQDALAKLDRLNPGIAILDINLTAGQTSEPVAEALAARGIPFIFVTGYGDTMKLGGMFASSPVLKKPIREDELRCALAEIET
ncbi:HWE histidine kinase domain-containing protein [Roseobacter sp.]|uniref:HWE histidine kinase domain-containing protein n=1 Tax=Roseobacter sp. TaxID=1907202 RepID=UPI002966D7DE|nr:HWE histidine kinase domain-containing protein [Roseobacter sp.]MDW3181853.1 HWE histidine kinase domain-containing protein [Roseobacter sp.]